MGRISIAISAGVSGLSGNLSLHEGRSEFESAGEVKLTGELAGKAGKAGELAGKAGELAGKAGELAGKAGELATVLLNKTTAEDEREWERSWSGTKSGRDRRPKGEEDCV